MPKWPLAANVAESVRPVLAVCGVTRDLYGYSKAVFDEAATRNAFLRAYRERTSTSLNPSGYSPGNIEIEVAMGILRNRADFTIREN